MNPRGVLRCAVAAAALIAATTICAGAAVAQSSPSGPISFGKSTLRGAIPDALTAIQFGPDGRLYVTDRSGLIRAYTIVREFANGYRVTDTETITAVRELPNHNDDGSAAPSVDGRLITGMLVTGTAASPTLYVTSADPRQGGSWAGTDVGLDTNSGIVSRVTRDGGSWRRVDLVRGLPRSEEVHVTNGLALSGSMLFVAQGGHTNQGAPSNNFARLPEYALSGAILSIDLAAIGDRTYDLPTLDDKTRAGTPDQGDPFGGNNGRNQAMLVPGGPVQVYSPGYRNAYDIAITSAGRMYTIDNGSNAEWGGIPEGEGPAGTCTNAVVEGGITDPDTLHLVSRGYYGGHPNPTRGNRQNGFNEDNQSPVAVANPIECDYRPTNGRGALASIDMSTNGLAEYTASNFGGALKGDLIGAGFDNMVFRIDLDHDGRALRVEELFASPSIVPLDVAAPGDAGPFPGTIWIADVAGGGIVVFEPGDYGGTPLPTCLGTADQTLDEDGDGYTNADEVRAGTNPCSAASVPADWDGDHVSNVGDPDDDNDGVADVADAFAIDAANGAGTGVPRHYGFGAGEGGGLLGLGFTGLMANGRNSYETLFDPRKLTAGGAAGILTIDELTPGDAAGSANTQQYAFQFGISPPATTFSAHTRLVSPFAARPALDGQSAGLFLGRGNQDDYVKLVLGSGGRILLGVESGGQLSTTTVGNVGTAPLGAVDLYLTVDPASRTVRPSWSVTTAGGTSTRVHGSAVALPAAWGGVPSPLAIGIIGTAGSSGSTFAASWDLVEVFAGGDAPPAPIVPQTPVTPTQPTTPQGGGGGGGGGASGTGGGGGAPAPAPQPGPQPPAAPQPASPTPPISVVPQQGGVRGRATTMRFSVAKATAGRSLVAALTTPLNRVAARAVSCRAAVWKVPLKVTSVQARGGKATCRWTVPTWTRAKWVVGSVTVRTGATVFRRAFAHRVR